MNSASHETHRPEPTVDRPEPTFGGKTVQEWREGDPVIDVSRTCERQHGSTRASAPSTKPFRTWDSRPRTLRTQRPPACAASPRLLHEFSPRPPAPVASFESPLVGIENMCRELSERYGSPYCGSARDRLPGPNRAVNEEPLHRHPRRRYFGTPCIRHPRQPLGKAG